MTAKAKKPAAHHVKKASAKVKHAASHIRAKKKR